MAWITAIATAASAAMSVWGALQQSKAQKELGASSAQAQIDMGIAQRDEAIQQSKNLQYNAIVQRNQAEVEEIANIRDLRIFDQEAQSLQGKQRAQFGFLGLGPGGSVAEVLEDTARKIAEDKAQLAFAGRARVSAIEDEAEMTERQARSVRRSGEIALRSGVRSALASRGQAKSLAGTSLLSGALSATNTILSGYDQIRRLQT